MDSKISKTSDPHRLLLNLTDKIDLQRKDKYMASPNLSIYNLYMKKYRNVMQEQQFQHQHGMKNLSYLMNHILYQIFKIILNIY